MLANPAFGNAVTSERGEGMGIILQKLLRKECSCGSPFQKNFAFCWVLEKLMKKGRNKDNFY